MRRRGRPSRRTGRCQPPPPCCSKERSGHRAPSTPMGTTAPPRQGAIGPDTSSTGLEPPPILPAPRAPNSPELSPTDPPRKTSGRLAGRPLYRTEGRTSNLRLWPGCFSDPHACGLSLEAVVFALLARPTVGDDPVCQGPPLNVCA